MRPRQVSSAAWRRRLAGSKAESLWRKARRQRRLAAKAAASAARQWHQRRHRKSGENGKISAAGPAWRKAAPAASMTPAANASPRLLKNQQRIVMARRGCHRKRKAILSWRRNGWHLWRRKWLRRKRRIASRSASGPGWRIGGNHRYQ